MDGVREPRALAEKVEAWLSSEVHICCIAL